MVKLSISMRIFFSMECMALKVFSNTSRYGLKRKRRNVRRSKTHEDA
jgi:hypothetical protein